MGKMHSWSETCSKCDGTGRYQGKPCYPCKGSGVKMKYFYRSSDGNEKTSTSKSASKDDDLDILMVIIFLIGAIFYYAYLGLSYLFTAIGKWFADSSVSPKLRGGVALAAIVAIVITGFMLNSYIPSAPVKSSNLYEAVKECDFQRAKYFIPKASPEELAKSLLISIENRSNSISLLLLARGAPINNEYPLVLKLVQGWHCHIPLLEMLLDKGASLEHVDDKGNTALHIAANKRDSYDIVKELLSRNIDVNRLNKEGLTPLDMAVRYYGTAETVDLLIKKGAILQENIANLLLERINYIKSQKEILYSHQYEDHKSNLIGILESLKHAGLSSESVAKITKEIESLGTKERDH